MKTLCIALILTGLCPAQDFADAPYSWAKFKPGTFKKTRMTTFGKAILEYTHTLKEVAGSEVVLDVATKTLATGDTKTEVMKSKLVRFDAAPLGEETLTFDGKDYKCTILKASYDMAGTKVESRHWVAKDIAFPLKTVDVSKGPDAWMNYESEALLVSLEAELEISGRKLKCARYQATVKGDQSGTATTWMNAEIPGGIARSETELGKGAAKMKMIQETIAFEVKK